ncbi:thiol reductase thioredoxin [Leptolyngbya sp. 'hensonii']|nr:thiol reductase thioredoxin [Leptolyngbya sp. 'hensonii']
MTGSVITISDADFETQVLQSDAPLVLAYFWASWCGPCRLVAPSVEWAAHEYSDRLKVVKIEVKPNLQSVAHCKVEGLPALRLFRQGEILDSFEGAFTRQKLVEFVENHF